MKVHITHRTEYFYSEPVPLCHNIVRLRPRDSDWQTCLKHELLLSPMPTTRREHRDFYDNHVTMFSVQEPHHEMSIVAQSEVVLRQRIIPEAAQSLPWESVLSALVTRRDAAVLDAIQYSFDSPFAKSNAELRDYALQSFSNGRPLLHAAFELTQRIHRDFRFVPGSTQVGTPVDDVMRIRQGVCQDFAHLQIACVRSLGLAARYVSGYVITQPPPGQARLTGADASHAWLSIFFPDIGWFDFDPTNGVMPTNGHIALAWARDYDDISPVKGIMIGGRRHAHRIGVDVIPELTPA